MDLKWDGLVVGSSSSLDSQRANYYDNNESTYGWDGYRCGLLYNGVARDYLNNNRSTLCSGWHVPTPTEWDTLISTVNSRFSCSQQVSWSQNWTGNNYMGLGFIPSGQRYQSDSSFHDIGNGNSFFSTAGYAYFMSMLPYGDSIHKESSMSYKSQYSLRLIKDT